MPRRPIQVFDALEQRTLLSSVTWDGGPTGTGTNFHDAANWAGDVLPTSADDAVIPAGASSAITITQAITLRTLSTSRNVTVRNTTLTVSNGVTTNARLTLGGDPSTSGKLRFSGSGRLDGTGEVLLGLGYQAFSMDPNYQIFGSTGVVITIGSGIEVFGTGVLGSPTAGRIENEGVIGGQGFSPWTWIEMRGSWTNRGTLRSLDGYLDLAGTYTADDLGTLAAGNFGEIRLTGTIQNAGRTLNLPGYAEGNVHFYNATVVGGTVNVTGQGTVGVGENSGGNLPVTFDGVTVQGNMLVAFDATLAVRNGLTVNGTLSLGRTIGFSSNGTLSFTGSQTLGGAGTVRIQGGVTSAITPLSGQLTIGPGITIDGAYYYGTIGGAGSVVNQGTINCSMEAGLLAISGSFRNEGHLRSSGTLNLDSITTANLGDFSSSGQYGVVRITGTLDNRGATLSLSNATGPLLVYVGGTLRGGVVNGSELGVLRMYSATLDGATVNADIIAQGLFVRNAPVVNGLVQLGEIIGSPGSSYRGTLRFDATTTLGGTGTIVFWGTDTSQTANEIVTNASGVQGTIGAGITIRGNSGRIAPVAGSSIRVLGSIIAEATSVFTIENSAGSVDLDGGLLVTAGYVTFNGTYTTAQIGPYDVLGGTLVFNGTIDNTGATLYVPTDGPSPRYACVIRGGVVTSVSGAELVVTSSALTLDGVTLETPIRIGPGSFGPGITIRNGIVLRDTITAGAFSSTSSNSAMITFDGTQTVQGNGAIVFTDVSNNNLTVQMVATAGSTVTIGSGITIRGSGGFFNYSSGTYGTFVNQGTIIASSAARPMVFYSTFINQGLLSAPGGVIDIYGAITPTNLGTFSSVGGTIRVRGTLDTTGVPLVLTAQTGSLTIQGGTLVGSNVVTSGGAQLIFAGSSNTWSGGVVSFAITLGSSTTLTFPSAIEINAPISVGTASSLVFPNDVTLNSTITLAGGGALMQFTGNRRITTTSAGTIVFDPVSGGGNRTISVTGTGAAMNIGVGITIRGGLGVLSGASSTTPLVINGQVLAQGGAISINSFATTNNGVLEADGFSLSINAGTNVNNGTLRVLRGGILSYANSANITGAVQGLEFGVGGGQFSFRGTSGYSLGQQMSLLPGQSIVLNSAWSLGADVTLAGGAIYLGGTFGLGAMARLRRDPVAPGILTIIGTVQLGGTTLTLGPDTGIWNLGSLSANGMLQNGTLAWLPGYEPVFPPSGLWYGILDNVALGGSLTPQGGVRVINGLTVNGVLDITHPDARLSLGTNQTFNGPVGAALVVGPKGDGTQRDISIDSGGTVTIAPNFTIRGAGAKFNGSAAIVNNGLIVGDTPGITITLNAGTITNNGRMGSRNGGSISAYGTGLSGNVGNLFMEGEGSRLNLTGGTYTLTQAWDILPTQSFAVYGGWNFGAPVRLMGGKMFFGGTVTPAKLANFSRPDPDAGEVNLVGTLSLIGTSFTLDDNTGDWNWGLPGFSAGTIQGQLVSTGQGHGTFTIAPGRRLIHKGNTSASAFFNLTINGDLTVDQAGANLYAAYGLVINGHIRLSGPGTYFRFNGLGTLTSDSSGEIILDGASGGAERFVQFENGLSATWTVGPNVTIRGSGQVRNGFDAPRLNFGGAIIADGPGRTLAVNLTMTNTTGARLEARSGGLMRIDGTVSGGDLVVSPFSTMMINNASIVPRNVVNRGTLSLGTRTLAVSNSYTQMDGARLNIDVQDGAVFGRVQCASASLAGAVGVRFTGAALAMGTSLRFFTASGAISGRFGKVGLLTAGSTRGLRLSHGSAFEDLIIGLPAPVLAEAIP